MGGGWLLYYVELIWWGCDDEWVGIGWFNVKCLDWFVWFYRLCFVIECKCVKLVVVVYRNRGYWLDVVCNFGVCNDFYVFIEGVDFLLLLF